MVDNFIANEISGGRLPGWVYKSALGTRGGLMILWDSTRININVLDAVILDYSISVRVCCNSTTWLLTNVYGPCDDDLKPHFFAEIRSLKPAADYKWLILGDFNVILSAVDKNNSAVNRRLLRSFRDVVNFGELIDIPLVDRRYTWSNEQSPPTLVRLNRALCNLGWSQSFANYQLIPLASSMSDHCPLLLCPADVPKRARTFRFENHWTLLEGFREQVLVSWNKPVRSRHPAIALNVRLRRLARDLRSWCTRNLGGIALQMELSLNIIANLDLAMDHRPLTPDETALRKELKLRVLGLAAIDRIR
ncbi:hypothetical protein BRADI_1g58014v3 [Brachypodium distachyon]|uniref:Endonuclease/exonuclease/phosphatase domain-containing protein n=1 Tax=Brachypodium distachyon TaxID=15368 RepID=A0A2K2DS73_BRADI|nr:hypothetical protein BRADI_1g58014v3 [Brachypodium distachyon]